MRGGIFWLGLAVILGGIVHIAAMLVIPALAPKNGYSRFEAETEPNTAVVVGPAVPGEAPFPYSSPDVVYVVCRYDVAENPVRFTATVPQTYWSLALYEPDGGNYYHTNSMQSATPDPDLVVHGRNQFFDAANAGTVAEASNPRGLMVLRIFIRDRSLAETMTQAASKADCASFEIQ